MIQKGRIQSRRRFPGGLMIIAYGANYRNERKREFNA